MVKFSPFSIRAGAILCCSVSVLLTACGGAVDANSAAGKAAKTAGVMVQNSAAQPGVDAAPATLAETGPAGTTPAETTQATGASSPVFDILGYDTDPLAAEPAADEAQAPATEGAAAPTRLLATLVEPQQRLPCADLRTFLRQPFLHRFRHLGRDFDAVPFQGTDSDCFVDALVAAGQRQGGEEWHDVAGFHGDRSLVQ